jgi:replicative DNA helicase
MIEDIVLSNLLFNEDYTRKVLAFLKDEYFPDQKHLLIYKTIEQYINDYNSVPSIEALKIELSSIDNINEDMYYNITEYVSTLKTDENTNQDWLLKTTEEFCQEKAIYNAIRTALKIIDGESKTLDKGALPALMRDALSVSFDTSIGHDYTEDFEDRYEFYHRKEEKIPFDLQYFNQITKGGVSRKTLSIIMASTGVGKSMVMCHMAAANLIHGKNVLYITMEMAEEKISERIDMNLLNITSEELAVMNIDVFRKRINTIKSKTVGKLIVKEYPTASAGSNTFRALLNELKLKKNFIPDIIYIDYLNICMSSRLKMGANVNSYTYIKTIAEELRGLAIEHNVPIISATQTNREGSGSSDPDIQNVSESWGLPATVDLMFALISDEELEKLNQMMVKQLKNRYDDIGKLRRFVIGVDKSHMKLYDIENSEQEATKDKDFIIDPDTGEVFEFSSNNSPSTNKKDKFKGLF